MNKEHFQNQIIKVDIQPVQDNTGGKTTPALVALTSRVVPMVGFTAALHTTMSSLPNLATVCMRVQSSYQYSMGVNVSCAI